MNLLPPRLIIAIGICRYLAAQEPEEYVQSLIISNDMGTARRYHEPILQDLVMNGILESIRGPKGGYRLAGDPTLDQIATKLGFEYQNGLEKEVWDLFSTISVRKGATQ